MWTAQKISLPNRASGNLNAFARRPFLQKFICRGMRASTYVGPCHMVGWENVSSLYYTFVSNNLRLHNIIQFLLIYLPTCVVFPPQTRYLGEKQVVHTAPRPDRLLTQCRYAPNLCLKWDAECEQVRLKQRYLFLDR